MKYKKKIGPFLIFNDDPTELPSGKNAIENERISRYKKYCLFGKFNYLLSLAF